MGVAKFHKCNKEEFKDIRIMLRGTELFSENYIRLIEQAMLNGMQIELPEEHIEKLEELGLVDTGREQPYANMRLSEQANEITTNKEETVYSPKDNITYEKENEYEDEKKEESMGMPEIADMEKVESEEASKEEEEQTIRQEDTNNEKENTEREDKDKESDKKAEKFMPKSLEDIKNIPEEEVAKRYYLTPERIIESMKRIKNGAVWNKITKSYKNFDLEDAIKRAYETGFWESDLANPNFLDERIKPFLPDGQQVIQLQGIHMAAVLGTYVGYHIEKTQGDIDEIASDGTEKSNITVVKFPLIVDEMPEELKNTIRTNLTNNLADRIEEIFRNNSGQRALVILRPIDEKMDELAEKYSDSLQDTEENKAVKAYIKVIRTDMPEKMKENFDELNVSMDLNNVNWNDPNSRKDIIFAIQELQGQGNEFDISKLIEEMNMSVSITSGADIEASVRPLCEDLSELTEQGIKVNIAFDLSAKDMNDIDVNDELNSIIGDYDNIERDYETEAVDNGTDLVIESAIAVSLAGIPYDNENNAFGSPERIIKDIVMGANGIDTDLEREEPEVMRRPLF